MGQKRARNSRQEEQVALRKVSRDEQSVSGKGQFRIYDVGVAAVD